MIDHSLVKSSEIDPQSTSIRFDCHILDEIVKKQISFKSDNYQTNAPIRYEYSFEFQPLTMNDHYILEEHIEDALRTFRNVNYGKHKDSSYELKDGTGILTNRTNIIASQLFEPKIAFGKSANDSIYQQMGRIKAHLRADPYGYIQLQVDYIDIIYQPTSEELQAEYKAKYPNDDIDDDW
jgi:hypothetical protein